VNKHYENGLSLSQKLLRGVDVLADNVGSTLGPKGRNVILFHKDQGVPVVTKDGVTVAKFVELDDPIENVGAQIVKQAAEQTASVAGDGTTTATVLSRAIIKESQKYLASGASPIELKRGMDKACEAITNNLKEMARPIRSKEDILHVATISANNDKSIGTLIAEAVDCVGKDGAIIIEEARSIDTSLDLIEGFRFDSGYCANAFINDERTGTVNYDNPLVLVSDEKVETVEQIYPSLEIAARETRPLVIIANDIVEQALAALVMNTKRGTMKVCAVKAPKYGEERRRILKDLCLSTGATFVTKADGMKLKDIRLTQFGQCKKINIAKGLTTVIGGQGDHNEVDKQIEALKAEIKQTDNLKECERIQERITRLASGIAVIRVGAATEVEMIEKKHRIEDALEAVRSAQEEGIVSGGGSALLHASVGLTVVTDGAEQSLGAKVVLNAVQAPLRQMCFNAGESGDLITDLVVNSQANQAYDFMKGDIVDALETGLIDPVKVTTTALTNAVSVASTLITTNYAIVKQ
jgi:chaperonin GroEL